MPRVSQGLSPKFSREELSAFLALLSDDAILLLEVYTSHETKQRVEARKMLLSKLNTADRKFNPQPLQNRSRIRVKI
jgi:hypothetical protein